MVTKLEKLRESIPRNGIYSIYGIYNFSPRGGKFFVYIFSCNEKRKVIEFKGMAIRDFSRINCHKRDSREQHVDLQMAAITMRAWFPKGHAF